MGVSELPKVVCPPLGVNSQYGLKCSSDHHVPALDVLFTPVDGACHYQHPPHLMSAIKLILLYIMPFEADRTLWSSMCIC